MIIHTRNGAFLSLLFNCRLEVMCLGIITVPNLASDDVDLNLVYPTNGQKVS